MLVDGIAPAPPMGAVAPPIDRPLLRMPGFSLRCDGGGSCCRIYPTTSFAPLERLRARSLAPERLDCGRDTRGAFTPERGSSFVPWRAASVCQVDGRCAFLDGEERCTLHERGGAEGKPLGCRLFPARLVDDGEVVRVAPAPECACVFASASSRTGEPLLDETITQRADLDPAIHVDALAPADAASGEQLARALQDAGEDGFDALEWLCGQAQTLTGAQRLDAAKQTLTLGVKRHLAMQHWRAPSDLARRLPEWMLAANGHGAAPTADDATGRDERFYLRCIVFGRLWLLDDAEPGDALWARAARLWCARAMHAVPMTGVPQSVAAHPLAGVEALARGFGW
jgi:lysine-N-methylase